MSTTNIKSISKVFANVNVEQPSSYSNYDTFSINWSPPDSYQLIKRVGRGKYSDVFLGVDIRCEREVIIKVLKPVRKRKIRREIKILENLRGNPNVISMIDVTLNDRNIPSIIFEYIHCSETSKFSSITTLTDIQYYMYELAKALYFSHSNGIMHRDVKPQNIIVDFSRRVLKLIDWGLAEFYHPGTSYNVRVASRYYKSPELLIDYQYYDYSLDIWSFGCVLAGLVFKKEPFFHGSDNKDQLAKVVTVLGSNELKQYLARYRHSISNELTVITDGHAGIPLEGFADNSNINLTTPTVLTLIKQCLVMDHAERLTAEQLLAHEFFKLPLMSHNNTTNYIH